MDKEKKDLNKDKKKKLLYFLVNLAIILFIAYIILSIVSVSYMLGYMMGSMDTLALNCPLIK